MPYFLLPVARCSGSFRKWLLSRTLFPVGLFTPAGASYAPLLGGRGRDGAACDRGEQDHGSRGQRTAQLREKWGRDGWEKHGFSHVYVTSSPSTYY